LRAEFKLDTLADISVGYTGDNIRKAVEFVLTKRRIAMMPRMPLRMIEFVDPLCHLNYCDHNLYSEIRTSFEGKPNVRGGNKNKKGKGKGK